MKRKTIRQKRNPYIIEGIQINEKLLKKYLHKEVQRKLTMLNDLSQISIKTDSELLKVLEQMIKSKNYFKYCSSILISINPGPNNIYEYLNLKKWSTTLSSKNINIEDKKPHLYTFMQYVYETMVKENKDQVVNFLGPIGSGKTFNLIHTMEFFTTMYGPKNYKNELFELIHNSIQLIHIFGSVYRENNIESTSCGILLKLEFNQNNIISNFDIDSKILDLSLPFSETGRSFNILHAFIKGANDDIRKKLKIPEDDKYLSFFGKYLSNYSEIIREKLAFNDLEIWNKFYSLSKYFKFSNDEVMDILKCLALILNLNELTISKVNITKEKEIENEEDEEKEEQFENLEYYELQKDKSLKKVCKNLGIKSKVFLNQIGKFKSLSDAKNFLISFMKQIYYIVFDFILNKIRDISNLYFNQLNEKIGTNNFKRNKIIYFLDFPGEVENKNLGGLTTNISHECLNMYAATGFYEIAEKLIKEKIYINKFFPIQSYFAVSTFMEKDGLLEHLCKPLNKQNLNSLINNCISKINFINCIKFKNNKQFEIQDYNFSYKFSYKTINYNIESLTSEVKSLLKNETITNIFSLSKNYLINSTYKNLLINQSNDFYSFFSSILCKIFTPIKDIKPFNIFYLHSDISYQIFNKDKDNKENLNIEENNDIANIKYKNGNEIENIPKELTLKMIKNSFMIPILFWNWQGYKEWISINEFIKEYSYDFEKIKDRIIQINNSDPERKKFDSEITINFNDLPKEEVAKCTLGVLSKETDYIIGKEYILMKTGNLKRMRMYLNSMIDTAEKMSNNLKEKIRKEREKENNHFYLRRQSSKLNENTLNKLSEVKKSKKRTTYINIRKPIEIKFKYEQNPLPKKKEFKIKDIDISRRHLLKEQCIINFVSNDDIMNDEEKRKILKGKYFNLFYLLTCRNNQEIETEDDKKNKIYLEEFKINLKDTESIKETEEKNILYKKDSFNKNKLLKKDKNEKYLDNIIKIQSHIRKLISRNKYIILKYIYSEIILLQKMIRGYLTRIKFHKFLECLKQIKKIQRAYHKRYIRKIRAATKIQDFYIRKLSQKKIREKIIAKKKAEAKGEYYNLSIEPFEDFSNNNYNLENALRIIRLQNKKEKLTEQLINEKDPKKILDILLYGSSGKKHLTRAEKFGVPLKIENKLINQGIIMKERKLDLSKKYEKKFMEKNKFIPDIDKERKIFKKELGKKSEFYNMFKENNIKKQSREDFKNNESEKIIDEKNYELYMKNIFDKLHNEKLQAEQRKKLRDEYLEKKINSKENDIKKSSRMSLKDLLLSAQMKEIYKNNSQDIFNSEIWPKNLNNIYLDKFKDNKKDKSLSPIKNVDSSEEEIKNELSN